MKCIELMYTNTKRFRMKRDYDTGEANDITFFTGVEVEKTPAFGMKTLFVTGIQTFMILWSSTKKNNANISSLVLITVTSQLPQMSLKTGTNYSCVFRQRYLCAV